MSGFNPKPVLKTSIPIIGAAFLLSILNSQLSTAFAQGSLTPPGAPAPTMITLNQIEPRTPISSAPYTITKPGSYYLTTNLTVTSGDAIDINASGVTLDLNGYTISSTSPFDSGTAIYINFVSNGGNYIGSTTTAGFADTNAPVRFYRVEAVLPLAP